jgi:hypothetical protein
MTYPSLMEMMPPTLIPPSDEAAAGAGDGEGDGAGAADEGAAASEDAPD